MAMVGHAMDRGGLKDFEKAPTLKSLIKVLLVIKVPRVIKVPQPNGLILTIVPLHRQINAI